MKILCHVGPNCKDQFEVIAKGLSVSSEVFFISGFSQVDAVGFARTYHNRVESWDKNISQPPSDEDIDMIARCRLLRSIPLNEAMIHIAATKEVTGEILDAIKPDFVLCESIDQFFTDILRIESERRNIRFIGLIRTFLNGYFRISARGEYVWSRKPDPEEVELMLSKLLQDSYLPSNLISIKKSLLSRYIKIWFPNLIKVPYFHMKRILTGEKFVYHYWATKLTTQQYYFHFLPKFKIHDDNWQEKLSKNVNPTIYIPLQHVPEATVDYWCDSLNVIDYEKTLIDFINKLSKDFNFLIKEHPGVLGFRKPSFYSKLSKLSEVTICPTGLPSQVCIDYAAAVLIWTGSVGFEAALRGKPVLALSNSYYSSGDHFFKIDRGTDIGEIKQFIESNNHIAKSEQLVMMSHLLSGFIKGTFKNDGTFDKDNKEDVRDAYQIGKELAALYHTDLNSTT